MTIAEQVDAIRTNWWTWAVLSWLIAGYAFFGLRGTSIAADTITILTAVVFISVPLVNEFSMQETLFRRVFTYTGVGPGLIVMILTLTGMVHPRMAVVVLFIIAGTGYWLWAAWVYLTVSTEMVQGDRMSKEWLGVMFVPIFTGTPLAVVLLFLGAVKGLPVARAVGVILFAISAGTLSFLMRNR